MSYWPKHAGYKSQRHFRASKRADLKRVQEAMDSLRLGCAYTPAYDEIAEIGNLPEKARDLLSAKNWGR